MISMQIIVENLSGRTVLPTENSKHNLLLYSNILLIRLLDKESVKLESNGFEASFSGAGEYIFPIEWDRANKCIITVRQIDGFYKYHFQLENTTLSSEEDITNLLKFVSQLEDTFRIGKEYSISELFEAISEDNVSLIIEKTPYSGYDDQSLLKRISVVVPMVMDICSHPKQSLRTEESVINVNLVKRINSRTLDHLSSHSEHWKVRTLNGLIPNRLRADIFEDEINIYENLFFRMAVDDILKYVHRQAFRIKKTIEQIDNAIDWNAYGETLYDYKRMRIFKQLLPDYDISKRRNDNNTLRTLLGQWDKLEKSLSTVEASLFYRSIDKKKHISRNIQPTNILKKDSRYNALYRLWCEIQRQIVQEQQESVSLQGSDSLSLADGYSMYVMVLLLYVFKLLECEIDKDSKFKLPVDGSIEVDAIFRSDTMTYMVKASNNKYGILDIQMTFVEKVSYAYKIPQEAYKYLNDIKKKLPKQAILCEEKHIITFYAKPSNDEQRDLKNLFHINQAAQKAMSDAEKNAKKLADKVWRQELEDVFASGKIKDAHMESIRIIPQFVIVDNTENAVEKFTHSVLNSAETATVFTLPIDIGEYKKNVHSDRLINRLLNYGEKYFDDDALLWGDYQAGIIPVAQSEINSAQRLMKLISIHASRLQIKWNKQQAVCPICGSKECHEESDNNWKCKNPECGVIFGITKHADGCGAAYEWTRPFVDIKKIDILSNEYIDLMLRKEIIFDRLAITDFEFEEQSDGTVKYIPICPKCGKRSLKYK